MGAQIWFESMKFDMELKWLLFDYMKQKSSWEELKFPVVTMKLHSNSGSTIYRCCVRSVKVNRFKWRSKYWKKFEWICLLILSDSFTNCNI
uniref:Ovule protein n=1 Tax=Syphacia muris TaxID=451379 RepID=A0A0N5B012_9BILA